MRLKELKEQLVDYDFELLHGLNKCGALDNTCKPFADRYNYNVTNSERIFDTFLFRNGFTNQMWSNVGMIVKDADLLSFSSGDGGRLENQTAEQITRTININEIVEYLESYTTNHMTPDYCQISLTNVEWGEIWINPSQYGFLSYIRQAIQFSGENNLPILEVNQNCKLVKYL